jgi:hypothetical protein
MDTMGGNNRITASIEDGDGDIVAASNLEFGLGDWATAPLATEPQTGVSLNKDTIILSAGSSTDAFADDTEVQFTVTTNRDGVSAPVLVSEWNDGTWNMPAGVLIRGTTYYWTAVARGASGPTQEGASVTSSVNSFVAIEGSAGDMSMAVGGDTVDSSADWSDATFETAAATPQPKHTYIYAAWLDNEKYRVILRRGVHDKIVRVHRTSATIVKMATQHPEARAPQKNNPTTLRYHTRFVKNQAYFPYRITAQVLFRVVVNTKKSRWGDGDSGIITAYCVQNKKVKECPTWLR